MKIAIKKLKVMKDKRGWLAEIIKPQDVRSQAFGQLIVTIAKPGQVKGNHFHKRKTEWYCVIKGKALLIIQDNNSGEKKKIAMEEKNITLVQIPPNHTHAIKNTGNENMYLLTYTDEVFKKSDPDTYSENLDE